MIKKKFKAMGVIFSDAILLKNKNKKQKLIGSHITPLFYSILFLS